MASTREDQAPVAGDRVARNSCWEQFRRGIGNGVAPSRARSLNLSGSDGANHGRDLRRKDSSRRSSGVMPHQVQRGYAEPALKKLRRRMHRFDRRIQRRNHGLHRCAEGEAAVRKVGRPRRQGPCVHQEIPPHDERTRRQRTSLTRTQDLRHRAAQSRCMAAANAHRSQNFVRTWRRTGRARGDQRHGARACLIGTLATCGDECAQREMEACRRRRFNRTFSKLCPHAKQSGCQLADAKNGAASMGAGSVSQESA